MSEHFEEFQGNVGLTIDESEPWWPLLPEHEHGPRPNVLIILFDDMGFAHLNCYGSTIDTPNINRLADEGLRYSNFHVTPLCSPTRASLMTGRNHHAVGMRTIANFHDTGFTNMRASVSRHSATLAEMLQARGYATYMVGKWHLSPAEENGPAGPYENWPLQRGFDRYYGFLSGATDQFYPELTHDNHHILPPRSPEEGYHVTEDLVDNGISFLRDKQSHRPDQPFFMYFALGAVHEPHQSPPEYVEKYRGRFDAGWDEVRNEWYQRQLASGIIPPDTELADRNPGVKRWEDLSGNGKRFAARLFEAFAGFLDHTDAQLGRLLQHLEDLGQLDNTIIVLTSDNGASGMGGPMGMLSIVAGGNGISTNDGELMQRGPGRPPATEEAERLEAWQSRLGDIGGPRSWTDIPWGWAQVANTPLRWYKSDAHGGGVRVPLIVRWPERVPQGQIRDQFHYVTDIVPTVLDVLGESAPDNYKGLAQMPVHGKSMAYTFEDPDAESNKGVQYFEMWGHRAIWMDGWKAVTRHFRGRPYDEDDWELFHLAKDFSETNNLAAQEPERLQKMIHRWWIEAGRYNVLPLDDRTLAGGPSQRPGNPHDGLHYRYYPPTAHLHGRVSPMLQLGDWTITAEVERESTDQEGVLFAHGSMAGGVSFYIQDNRLCLDFNSREDVTVGRSDSELPAGMTTVSATLASSADKSGVVTLFVDGEESGTIAIPDTSGIAVRGGADIGADHYSPTTGSYEAPFEFAGTIHVLDVRVTPRGTLPRPQTPREASESG
ncbi:MAG: sulfatase-like hydrolase/transferase [Chloroflexi bacterium]|nr:sulfatase-like hydrolase/transferase [Chloroflexota bacterium]